IPLLKNGLAPLSFMEMDRARYVEGLLAFYELHRIDILKEAYIQGYVGSAARYDAYSGRDRAAMELEFRRRTEIYACVKSYGEPAVAAGQRIDWDAFARGRFRTHRVVTRSQLMERVHEIIAALNEANHIAYGIPRETFNAYERLRGPMA